MIFTDLRINSVIIEIVPEEISRSFPFKFNRRSWDSPCFFCNTYKENRGRTDYDKKGIFFREVSRILVVILSMLCCFSIDSVWADPQEIRYVALGDSYTAGTGASPEESWPVILTERLKADGWNIKLIANLARSAGTTQNVIDQQLPVYKTLKPNFATVLIGANDLIQGVSPAQFRRHLSLLLGEMVNVLPNDGQLLVVTIPDFFITPAGAQFSMVIDVVQGIRKFNAIIKEEAERRNLALVDIFPVSQQMGQDASLIGADGLHPSAKAYASWAELIAKKVVIPKDLPQKILCGTENALRPHRILRSLFFWK